MDDETFVLGMIVGGVVLMITVFIVAYANLGQPIHL